MKRSFETSIEPERNFGEECTKQTKVKLRADLPGKKLNASNKKGEIWAKPEISVDFQNAF
jgi:hypothetical protein